MRGLSQLQPAHQALVDFWADYEVRGGFRGMSVSIRWQREREGGSGGPEKAGAEDLAAQGSKLHPCRICSTWHTHWQLHASGGPLVPARLACGKQSLQQTHG
jgi:hypothetical protein